jgi:hypothetical protein
VRFNPTNYQVGDTDWLVSKHAYLLLRRLAHRSGRSQPATARRVVNSFLRMSRDVDYDLSKIKFDIAKGARNVPARVHIKFREGDIEGLCTAGQFGPADILEIALSCRGLKDEYRECGAGV